jgi:branched-chain amino acid transport system permease protein
VGGSGNNFGAILGGFAVWFLWIESAPIALFLINFFTVGIPATNTLKVHLIESVPYFRFLMMGLGLLLIMRYRPKGILPEKNRNKISYYEIYYIRCRNCLGHVHGR